MSLASRKFAVSKNGRGQGIIIPFTMLKRCNISKRVEVEIEKDRIVLKPAKSRPRDKWDKAFNLMHQRKDDVLLLDESINGEMKDWEWE